VLQGERPLARDNRTLGRFQLVGIPPAPRGVPQIEVAFDTDANGIVSVSAKDLATGKEQKITITASSGLSKQEVDRLVKEAQTHAADDQQRRELIDARNEADALAYSVEKALNETSDRVSAADRSRVESAIDEARQASRGDDVQAIKQGVNALQRASQALAEAAARQTRSGQTTGSGSDSSNVSEGEVIDAEPVQANNRR
jgi:molecular chaperone DnaK